MSIPRARALPLLFAAVAALGAAGCGNGRPTSTLLGTIAPGDAAPASAAGPTSSARTAATTTVVPGASTTAPAAPTTATSAGAPDPATTAPAGPTASTAAPPPPASTGAPAGGAAARVAALYTRLGYAVSDAEATCLAGATGPDVVTALEAGGETALVGAVTSGFVQALARCEPVSFLEEQDLITVEDYAVAPAAARCVTKALNAAAVADPAIALAYYEGTTTLPPAGQQKLIDALTPCVGAAKAREIITT